MQPLFILLPLLLTLVDSQQALARKRFNKAPATVDSLEEFGQVRLLKSFFMRDFLYSEISQIEGIPNIPDDPELAILVG